MVLRVAVLGYGAIGQRVVGSLATGGVPGAELLGVVVRTPGAASAAGHPEVDLTMAIARCDLIVECAGVDSVGQHGPTIIAAGRDLLVASLGALVNEPLRRRILAGPGRAFFTAGAIGGLDLLGAASRDGGLDSVSLTTSKRASTLIQPWMDASTERTLRTSDHPITIFDGDVLEAIRRFPRSLNIAVALALATELWAQTTVRLIADPAAEATTHEIRAQGRSGRYSFSIANHPLESNPASSAIVSDAILHGIAGLAHSTGRFV